MDQTLKSESTLLDEELVARAIRKDHEAFAVLYDRYAPLVRATCRRSTSDLNAAQDLTQEVFLRAYLKLSTLRKPEKFGAWVTGIAKLAAKSWHRRKQKIPHDYLDEMSQIAADTSLHDAQLDVLAEAMLELDEQEQFALDAYYLQEKPVQEAKGTLGLSTSGFYKLLDRARKRLGNAVQSKQQDLHQ